MTRKLTIIVPDDIEASYRDMVADQAREQEALEWLEGVISLPTDPMPRPHRRGSPAS